MADVVQFKLERMLPELDDLERRGLFNRREIAEIVKQRRKFEYRLKRPSPLKQDFLAYIDYERRLDALRILRKKAQLKEQISDRKQSKKKSISDFAGVSRIIEIYRLATNRFKGDLELWFQYLEFCREKRNGRMKKALAQVIRFHPKVPGVWIYAAAWEFDQNLNAAAARSLMQNGLRACPASEDIWVEYLRMELTYLNKLKARKVALGEGEGTLTGDPRDTEDKKWKEENKELFMALDDDEQKNDKTSEVQNESRKKFDLFWQQSLSILKTIYNGALEALPSSFTLRMRFLEILEATDLAHSEDMRKEILSDMKRDFSKEPKYWNWLARLEIVESNSKQISEAFTPEQLKKAIQVYEEGLEVIPSSAMFNLYVEFLKEIFDHTQDGVVDPVSHLSLVYEKAESMGCITEDLACQYVSFLLKLGKLDEAKMLAEKLCCGKFSSAVHLWELRISIEMRCIQSKSPTKAALSSIFELLRDVLMKVGISEAQGLWLMALKFFSCQPKFLNKLVQASMISLAKDGGNDDGFSLSSAIVNYILQKDGIQRARELYKRFLALPHPGLALYKNCIELELNIASTGDKDCLTNARKLYESALSTYSQDDGLWRDYYYMEVKMGTSETAASVQWRARKMVKALSLDRDL